MMRLSLLSLLLPVLLGACASNYSTTANGISIADAPKAINRVFSDFDGLVDDANRAINRSLNGDSSTQGKTK
ncbi:hypothetical protein [Bordetella holmesii]|uniref:Lipoprotein n=3 Tax=Bordetella holmesii TaxID=35814 RepID=A0ABP3BD54_9BORD|nr:hypothetical protein [Bordetella holmesii]AHV94118.1 putative lipoprotein [Bordetella holmesii ATCC 51541]AIT26819.1 putative lipoprotein [Bordetella holmesii 44057]EWM43554.1 putative lipoprotein [Bordetella holmesii 41130]EWM47409.1 putative lipoprotein [Bordetella holmesii 35009]KAK81008.1 putative lipoprotein [Bordetella holmesii CDC-H809-BH]KAL03434.1 putative lipoprotein [Bordetella holmesii CDC-H635-BH]KCV04456.1 putative lipoprotein [Bordetella holmesii CDC-H719-BH]KCV11276.1 put